MVVSYKDKISKNIKHPKVNLKTIDIENKVKAQKFKENKDKMAEERRLYNLFYIDKWRLFRDRKDIVVERYVKVRNKMVMLQTLVAFCKAHQVLVKVWTLFSKMVKRRRAYATMMFLLKC